MIVNKKNKYLSHKKLLEANADFELTAKVAKLIYVNDKQDGIARHLKGKKFIYLTGKKKLSNKKTMERIKKLTIPPAWTNVWICRSEKGHLQATGYDANGRKQYRYHSDWSKLRNETKFHHMYEFGKNLPLLRKKIANDISSKTLDSKKAIAAALDLMDKTYIRIGNEEYEQKYGTYGITTLQDKHVTIKQNRLSISFCGKRGIKHSIVLNNRKLAKIIKQCRDIPGKSLFQYYTDDNNRNSIDSAMLNEYIQKATGPGYSGKDIRTWAGSVHAIKYLSQNDHADKEKNKTKNTPNMIDYVSKQLGNSKNICKKYYIHPYLIDLCEHKQPLPRPATGLANLTKYERTLMSVLKRINGHQKSTTY
jgi:DNA topoisomerase I